MIKEIGLEQWKFDRYGNPAGLGVRLMCLFIDGLVFVPVGIVLWLIEFFVPVNIPTEVFELLFIVYLIVYHWKKGATIGKKQTEVRVETLDGGRITLLQSVIRASLFLVSWLIFVIISFQESLVVSKTITNSTGSEITISGPANMWLLYMNIIAVGLIVVDAFWILTNKDKRALHDVLAKTRCRVK
ncbi:hypothetical protein GCM10009122_04430 [Fulvivirga kasyanovii]|uniref:RDD family protein n=1 Tax=Fulvivirga kasyanovii TaxID=396812 RepID=UPI0031D742FC